MNKSDFTQEEIEKAYDRCDGCMSCGWKDMFSRTDFEITNNPKFPNEMYSGCDNDEIEYADSHRGCWIYPVKE